MRGIYIVFILIAAWNLSFAQSPLTSSSISKRHAKYAINFNGQWKGEFDEVSRSEEANIGYVLELTTEGTRVSGYSYSYFKEYGKSYYTICRVIGTVNPATKEIVVTEIERTKFNTPPTFINCFQTHRLTYQRRPDNTEILKGTWEPAPNQLPGCGKGETVLSRKVASQAPLAINRPQDRNTGMTPTRPAPAPKRQAPQPAPKNTPPVIAKKEPEQEPVIEFPKSENATPQVPVIKPTKPATPPHPKLLTRRTDIVKTIHLQNNTFRLDFYDNGEIDGDSISVFFNGKLVMSNQMLTDKPISLTLTADPSIPENIVTMYAENLGSIPPNTAVMIVTDGRRRYEVRMESDLKKSGSVVFTSPE